MNANALGFDRIKVRLKPDQFGLPSVKTTVEYASSETWSYRISSKWCSCYITGQHLNTWRTALSTLSLSGITSALVTVALIDRGEYGRSSLPPTQHTLTATGPTLFWIWSCVVAGDLLWRIKALRYFSWKPGYLCHEVKIWPYMDPDPKHIHK